MNIRAFFALPIPDRISRALADYADTLCEYDRGLDAHWVDSAGYHLTLCFLNEITLDQVQMLERAVAQALDDIPSFQLNLDTLDYYPVNTRLAVIAALTSDPAPLAALQERLAQVVKDSGIDYHEKGFRPHVTLGRLPSDNRFEAPECWPVLREVVPVDSVVLFQSRPGERGSIYTPLFETRLPAPWAASESKDLVNDANA
ncbi:2'-5' RNA ligase [Marinobacterium lacunae]|uniref:RNA 2',3'-cyclic phosphodiesterase n=1 Tax=Marinobacterium lacunae TaxID=1232683 RepID=A0A081FXH2_9GAMM|nr:RNA 2',3'-cyclic phosphodiesterase [Marinobacterium lacunae]KEA63227.1 2'-5' RNA ligase [Marinobacterium lacunae]MBR9882742.1 RNA 2',3'-cyclic phosphodiesterase [Oceanospirillales bacterium]